MKSMVAGSALALALAGANAARADVVISSKATANMSCSQGVCSPTAKKAVLNATDLTNLLAGGDATVTTGSGATNIVVQDAFSWTSTSRLTLDAIQSVEFDKPVTVAGTGAVTITVNDGGSGGDLLFNDKASLTFWDLSSSLIINGSSYTLVGDIKTLAADIAANPSGFYALAKSYDASVNGTYVASAIPGTFEGTFEGLGSAISNFTMQFKIGASFEFGFFEKIGTTGIVRDFGLAKVNISGKGSPSSVGALVSENEGTVQSCWATGTMTTVYSAVGGLVSGNDGTIVRSYANVQLRSDSQRYVGGLAAGSDGIVSQSYASGSVGASNGSDSADGGLLGLNDEGGEVVNSFSVGTFRDGAGNCCEGGGLVGKNATGSRISSSYAAGTIRQKRSGQSLLGGLVGYDDSTPGSISNGYWDLDKGISDPTRGAGNIDNDPGITGLTTQQLQAGLPPGFDHKVWAQDPKKNNGFPYLREVRPPN